MTEQTINKQKHTLILEKDDLDKDIKYKIFEYFSDDKYDENALISLNQLYPNIIMRIYVANVFETYANILTLGCIFKKISLVETIKTEDKMHQSCVFGTCQSSTPYELLSM